MKTITVNIFTFDELSEPAKENARGWYRAIDSDQWAWETTKEDAENIGLKIISLEDHKGNEGEFIGTAVDTCEKIITDHGPSCDTHKTAMHYRDSLKRLSEKYDDSIEDEENYNNHVHEFLHDLLEDYRAMINKEIEYQNSNEYVDENIIANEYTFTDDGKRFK